MHYVLAILGLGILIIVHELGHMLVARFFGMRVEKFSVGFGPPLLLWRGKKTTYQVAAIPLGGFVQIAGMNPQEKLEAQDTGSYANKTPGARFLTIAAGPLTNYLFAMVLMVGIMLAWGYPHWEHVIAEVEKGSPAGQAGMRENDQITAIDGHPMTSITDVVTRISQSKGNTIELRIQRNNQPVTLKVKPVADGSSFRIGIQFGKKISFSDLPATSAFALGVLYPIQESANVLAGLKQLFSGRVSLKQVGGPLEIVRQLKMSFEESMVMALIFLAMLNVYLGLFNLLPLPALDGGRLIFLFYTILTRRPVNQQAENLVHTIGFFLLLGLLILLSYKDLARMLASP